MNSKQSILWLVACWLLLSLACQTLTGGEPADSVTLDDVVVFNNLSQAHDEDLREDYGPLPPPGGTHNPVWQNCGFYSEPVWTEMALHSLEHGTVWITYHPDLPADQISYLRGLSVGHTHVLVSPYPGLASDVVLSAWGLQLEVPSVPDPIIEEFIAEYENGPQNPEPGAPCSGGFGNPE